MSEIYLTKIERKTIFTKAFIFVLIMVIISDLTVTGPFWFNFIPWMFLIGTIGSIKKIDGVLMSVMGTFMVFVSSLLMQGGLYFECILNTIVTLVNIILGIITGKICYEFILEHRLVKYIKRSRKIVYISLVILMFIISYLIVGLNSGNIVTYLKSRNNLKSYITKTYNIQDFAIVKAKHVKTVPGKYTYRVKMDGWEVSFVPVAKDVFKDTNKDNRFILATHNLEKETSGKVQDVLNKYSLFANANAKFKLEYNTIAINPDTVVLHFNYNESVTDENMDNVYEQISSCVKELQNVKQSQKIIITINEKALQLSYENIENLTADYIKGGFEIEEISE